MHRNKMDDPVVLQQSILMALVVFCVVELAIYANIKSMANLFLQVKISQQQQE